MKYSAHKNNINNQEQPLKEHLLNTAVLASQFAIERFSKIAFQSGLLHDIGKYQSSFQRRLNGDSIRIEHALCGAKEALKYPKQYSAAACMLAYCIIGHHSGLPDGGSKADSDDMSTLNGRLKRESEDYGAYKSEVSADCSELEHFMDNFKGIAPESLGQEYVYLTRYIFSCLTDADFLDTERFFNENQERSKIEYSFEKALELLNEKFKSFKIETELQRTRSGLQAQAYDNMDSDKNLFFLNMPTGSGKTLCSLKLALDTAIRCKKKRIIYVIPYTSIIEQTAKNFEDILQGSLPVVQHHSNYTFENIKSNDCDEESTDNLRLMKATENWDAPLIVTTSVQFFQSLHANRGSSLRKIHNLASSVIILDEAHLLPLKYFQSCINSLSFLSGTLDSKIILMSATLPDYENLFKRLAYKDVSVCNLIKDKSLFSSFDKCRYTYLGKVSDDELAMKSADCDNALIIVNSRKSANRLYTLLSATGRKVYHLSTYMTPFDRKNIIEEIRAKLKSKEKITVVSTTLIEAGVDLDFNTVFRELSGLDSILQAGGRCNREGRCTLGDVFIFDSEENLNGDLSIRANITKGLIKKYNSLNDASCIEEYYSILLDTKREELTKNTIQASRITSIPFASYASEFSVIDSNTIGIAVERDEHSRKLIKNLKYNSSASVRRELQKYSATVYYYEFENLKSIGVIDDYGTGIYCLLNTENYYCDNTGIKICIDDSRYIYD